LTVALCLAGVLGDLAGDFVLTNVFFLANVFFLVSVFFFLIGDGGG
jgi:hypothetical protein